MMEYHWLPHVERLLIFMSVMFVGIGLYRYYRNSDSSLEIRFITRDDFRRVEAKLDTVLNIAAYMNAENKFRVVRRKKTVDT
jgi:hypothetical protein